MSASSSPRDLETLLAGFTVDPRSELPAEQQEALFLARRLQERAVELQTPSERRQQLELDRMLQRPADKATLVQMTDQAFRARSARRIADQFIHILDVQGIPRCFSSLDRTLLKGFQSFGGFAPGVAVPFVKAHMQKETANVILPGEREMLTGHLRARREEGVRMNVNYLGEAILGEPEAERRLQAYLQALQWPEIEVVSIKISTLYSQISPLAREHTLDVLCDRLELLYREAGRIPWRTPDGRTVPKFVYLDMEEYRDLTLTAEAFMRTLERPGLEGISAGIALQSYIPDSHRVQLQLTGWARRRVARGHAPITIRLVKGANLEMERVEASLRDWPQATYPRKAETDANYKRMLHEGLRPENLAAVRIGVASHNLFDLAYGLVLARRAGALDRVQFEMLEGMANPQRRALFELSGNLLLYAPACHREHFLNAIGYLIRRLDENTGPENFLRHAFRLRVGSPDWNALERAFLDSFRLIPSLSDAPRRTQNRLAECPPRDGSERLPREATRPAPVLDRDWSALENEPDTDFSLPQNSDWALRIIEAWKPRWGDRGARIPLVITGTEILPPGSDTELRRADAASARPVAECRDPSRPGVRVGRYLQANAGDVEAAVACARSDPAGWRSLAPRERSAVLGRVAEELRLARADLIGAALANAGKTIAESDPEVSEAVDFVEFYRDAARWWQEQPSVRTRPRGVVLVVPPWNFPIAIPCGGIAAALAAGNTVIVKPASDAVWVAWELCRCFWRAGVPSTALQFVPCLGSREGRLLARHPGVDSVVLTGGTDTAFRLLAERPDLHLCAETGGKNATIVTALADRDLAIKHVLHSAFSHAGQKCSATSLLLLEDEVYDDPAFRRALVEAVESLPVGSAWEPSSRVGPLIRPPAGDLETALKTLEEGEEWAVRPRLLEGNPHLWTPGVKWGVRPGSFTHLTEFFGPLLGVMRFTKLEEAVAWVNQTGYGLTAGIESLDDREIAYWQRHVRAGNLYVNRVTTGAIVLRQPFGGMGKSAFGPGIKAGGPNYPALFMQFEDRESAPMPTDDLLPDAADLCDGVERAGTEHGIGPGQLALLRAAAASYCRAWREEFAREQDHLRLVGQDNLRRYLPVRRMRIRVHPEDTPFDLFARVLAARLAGCRITVSSPAGVHPACRRLLEEQTEPWGGGIEFLEETDEELATAIADGELDRLRYAAVERVPAGVYRAAAGTGLCIVSHPVLREGRVELLWCLEEQSLSVDYHRYGNLGLRSEEPRRQPR